MLVEVVFRRIALRSSHASTMSAEHEDTLVYEKPGSSFARSRLIQIKPMNQAASCMIFVLFISTHLVTTRPEPICQSNSRISGKVFGHWEDTWM